MNHSEELLRAKLTEMYPDIANHGVQIGLHSYRMKDLYIVTLKKNCRILTTFLTTQDMEGCMIMRKPRYFDIQVHQFLNTISAGEKKSPVPACTGY
ncbi:MAG: hypothetical protein ACOYVJ_12100 [Nitrospirota bacterium]